MRYTLERNKTVTTANATHIYMDSFTVVKLSWYRRLWGWLR